MSLAIYKKANKIKVETEAYTITNPQSSLQTQQKLLVGFIEGTKVIFTNRRRNNMLKLAQELN